VRRPSIFLWAATVVLLLGHRPVHAGTLNVFVQSLNKTTGAVVINGGDSRGPTTPFTFQWGDGASSQGFFPLSHRYADVTKNYTVKVTAHYSGGATDSVETSVEFVDPTPGAPPDDERFDYKRQVFGSPPSLGIGVGALNGSTGQVILNGSDSQGPSTPFVFEWGDGTRNQGFFPQTHRYADLKRNYIIRVTARYTGGAMDTAETVVLFTSPPVAPKPLPAQLAVTIPAQPVRLLERLPFGLPNTLVPFEDRHFGLIPRSTVEYVLSAAAAIQADLANNDLYRADGTFRQVMLRDPAVSGGMYSLWHTVPVAFGVGTLDGSYGLKPGAIAWSSFMHEMGHNVTLNTPARYVYGVATPGSGAAIYAETMAQIFQQATAFELVNQYREYGLSRELAHDVKRDAIATMGFARRTYEEYLRAGKHFTSWDDPTTQSDNPFHLQTFITVAFRFYVHAETDGLGYREPVKRMMRLLQAVSDNDLRQRYDSGSNTPEAAEFRSTLMVAALSHAFSRDLRDEFRGLDFPVSDALFSELIGRAR
jgi:hypothetical protein